MRTRLSSSGIARSNERIPASTCATGMRACAAASAAGERRVRVAVDEHDVGALVARAAARARRACARSARCSCRRGSPARARAAARRAPRRRSSTARRRSAGRCGRAARRARARSRRETAAALTNCGRLPMTVRTFTRPDGVASSATMCCVIAAAAALRSAGRAPRAARAVDRVHRVHLAQRRGQERLA